MVKKSNYIFATGAIYLLIVQGAIAQTAPAPYVTKPYIKGEKSTILSTRPPLTEHDGQLFHAPELEGVMLQEIPSEAALDRGSSYITVEEVGSSEGDWTIVEFISIYEGMI